DFLEDIWTLVSFSASRVTMVLWVYTLGFSGIAGQGLPADATTARTNMIVMCAIFTLTLTFALTII
ncbi:MAG: hypothetical protein SGPRY_009562, partial [Prymnesium sp.]